MTRRLRILHVGNGRAHKIWAIVDGMLQRGHEVHFVPIPPCPGTRDDVAWHELPSTSWPGRTKVLRQMSQLRSLALRLRPDVVHAHNAWGPGWLAAASGIRPFVIHGYGGDLLPEQYRGRSALQKRLTSWACRRADRIIVTGRHMIDASGALGIDPERVTLLPRGVDLELYRPGADTPDWRQSQGLADSWPIILSPRYQVDELLYNLDVVIDAFALIRQRFPSAICIQLYEPGRLAGIARLQQLAAAQDLGSSYRLVPAVPNRAMPPFYSAATVTVSVPSSDGFPVTVLEASACGSPLVVSDLPYCSEWFANRSNGLIVPARNAAALAEAVIEYCSDPALAQRVSAEGRRLVAERADYRVCMDQLEHLYFQLLREVAPDRTEAS